MVHSTGDPDAGLEDSHLWTQLGHVGRRDLDGIRRDALMAAIWEGTWTNPVVVRYLNMAGDYIWGDGMSVVCADDKIQEEVVDEFWNDPVNDCELKMPLRVEELSLFGEQIWQLFVNPENGAVQMGSIDSGAVGEVATDRHNREVAVAVGVKSTGVELDWLSIITTRTMAEKRATRDNKPFVALDETGKPMKGELVGDVLYIAINKALAASRGISDLTPVIEVLDILDGFVLDSAERMRLLSLFVWQLTMDGATPTQLQTERDRHRKPPKPGSVVVANEKMHWDAITPDLRTADIERGMLVLKGYAGTGLGVPPTWWGDGGDANRATAAEMGSPPVKRWKRKQATFKRALQRLIEFVIDKAVAYRSDLKGLDTSFNINVDPIVDRDFSRGSAAFAQTTGAISVGLADKYITHQEASNWYRQVAAAAGIDTETDSGEEDEVDPKLPLPEGGDSSEGDGADDNATRNG